MRTIRLVIIAAVFTSLLGPPVAANAVVSSRSQLKGGYGFAQWDVRSGTTRQTGFVDASEQPRWLYVTRCTDRFDTNGTYVSTVCTLASTQEFIFTIGRARLTAASVTAADVPAQRCTYIGFADPTCTPATIGLNVTWIGKGAISRDSSTFHEIRDGFAYVAHANGSSRRAIATGTVGDRTFIKGALSFARIGYATSGSVDVCLAPQPCDGARPSTAP